MEYDNGLVQIPDKYPLEVIVWAWGGVILPSTPISSPCWKRQQKTEKR